MIKLNPDWLLQLYLHTWDWLIRLKQMMKVELSLSDWYTINHYFRDFERYGSRPTHSATLPYPIYDKTFQVGKGSVIITKIAT